MRQNHLALGLVLGTLATILFAASLPMTRLAVAALDPWFVTAARGALAGLVALVVLVVLRRPVPWGDLPRLALIAGCLVIGFPGLMAVAMRTVPSAHGGVILGLLPMATAVAAVFVAGEKPSLFFWAMSVLGAAFVVAFSMRDQLMLPVSGDLILFLSIAICGTGYAFSGTLSRRMPGWEVISWAVAIGLRLLHRALLTQVALLVSVTTFAGLLLSWLESLVVPQRQFNDIGDPVAVGGPDPLLLVLVSAAWWLVLALIVGLIGLREANTTDEDPAAGRRAALTRLWAGLVAVIGLATAVTRSDYTYDPVAGNYGRVIEPWIGDLAILVLAAILVERAFRRDASTFVYAAALGLMVALSDFNFTYLSSSTELGLLIEGVILLGAGVGADRLRRRIGREEPEPEIAAPVAPA